MSDNILIDKIGLSNVILAITENISSATQFSPDINVVTVLLFFRDCT